MKERPYVACHMLASVDGKVYPREDYVADSDVKNYIVFLNPKGVLG